MGSKKYIHYGHSSFNHDLFCEIKNRELFVKPWGGLWASDVDAEYGWKDWCVSQNFYVERLNEHFIFTLSDDAKVLHIYDVKQLEELPQLIEDFDLYVCLDFEQLLADGWDVIELHLSEEKVDFDDWFNRRGLYFDLYGWDCDSILIMNPEVIICV